jgi:serine protease Do
MDLKVIIIELLIVLSVCACGAADKAGIKKGSIITKFDGTSVASSTAVVDRLAYYEIGETVELEIAVPTSTGEYETKTVNVTLQAAAE